MSVIIHSSTELSRIGESCRIVSCVLGELVHMLTPGITTRELELKAEEMVFKMGGEPAFKGYKGFPGSLCASVNEQVVHGVPGSRILVEGDIVSLDLGVKFEDHFGDAAVTVGIGEISAVLESLLKVTREALFKGIENARAGKRVSDISNAIQAHVEANGYSVVREFVGHGIGSSLHEEPQIPNFGESGHGARLRPGMVLAVEPMVNMGECEVKVEKDNWTVVTADGKPSAHFEHTIEVRETAPRILTYW